LQCWHAAAAHSSHSTAPSRLLQGGAGRVAPSWKDGCFRVEHLCRSSVCSPGQASRQLSTPESGREVCPDRSSTDSLRTPTHSPTHSALPHNNSHPSHAHRGPMYESSEWREAANNMAPFNESLKFCPSWGSVVPQSTQSRMEEACSASCSCERGVIGASRDRAWGVPDC
jgi:hypothetical protein